MADFTPGPWYWDTENGWLVAGDSMVVDGSLIVLSPDRDRAKIDIHPDTPDARLIAASPEMYEALKGAEDQFMELLVHVGQLPKRYQPFHDAHIEIGLGIIQTAFSLVKGGDDG